MLRRMDGLLVGGLLVATGLYAVHLIHQFYLLVLAPADQGRCPTSFVFLLVREPVHIKWQA